MSSNPTRAELLKEVERLNALLKWAHKRVDHLEAQNEAMRARKVRQEPADAATREWRP